MQTWEYLWLSVYEKKRGFFGRGTGWELEANGKQYPVSEFWAVANELGSVGWELVATMPFAGSYRSATVQGADVAFDNPTVWYYIIFKRPT